MTHSRTLLLILLLFVPALLLGACDSDDAEDIATEVDETGEDVGEEIDEAAEDVGDEIDEAAEDVEDEVEDLVGDDENVVEYLRDEDNFSTLVSLIDAAYPDISDFMEEDTPVTIIAPTNEAFSQLMDSMDMTLAEFEAEHPDLVQDLLMVHSIDGRFTLDDLRDMDGETLTTSSGEELSVRVEDDTVFIADVELTAQNDDFDNAVILTVDQVLLPPSMQE